MARYVALLRAVNVGGKNRVPMPALRALLEAEGLQDVVTYIQSGNAVFTARERPALLVPRLERALSQAFRQEARVVLRSRAQLRAVVERAPEGFGGAPDRVRYDVLYLKAPLTAREALAAAPARPGVDEVHAGPGVLYYARVAARAAQSRMSRIVALPMYQLMTIRSWNTTVRLLELVEGRGA
jgi:uncharacterized protein (DUF1697 family)